LTAPPVYPTRLARRRVEDIVAALDLATPCNRRHAGLGFRPHSSATHYVLDGVSFRAAGRWPSPTVQWRVDACFSALPAVSVHRAMPGSVPAVCAGLMTPARSKVAEPRRQHVGTNPRAPPALDVRVGGSVDHQPHNVQRFQPKHPPTSSPPGERTLCPIALPTARSVAVTSDTASLTFFLEVLRICFVWMRTPKPSADPAGGE